MVFRVKKVYLISFCFLAACVDRVYFDVHIELESEIVISGHISDQPGPYYITVSKSFDIESRESLRSPLSVKSLQLSDNIGNREELKETSKGNYETTPGGIQGQVGRIYTLHIELLDGRVYESLPDTLLAPGSVDSLYYHFTENEHVDNLYGFDVYFNASGKNAKTPRFMWTFTGTYKADTKPYLANWDSFGCNPNENGICNFYPPCTGLRKISLPFVNPPIFEKRFPCTCCTCWYKFSNTLPLLNDASTLFAKDKYQNFKIFTIPLSGWTFMYKVHVEVQQLSLTSRTFRFYELIRAQKEAVDNLFQPVSGKIPSNFIQISGASGSIQGIFYAAGVSKKELFIGRNDVPNEDLIPSIEGLGQVSCLNLFPNSTTQRPAYWVD